MSRRPCRRPRDDPRLTRNRHRHPRTAGFAAEFSPTLAEDAIEYMSAPIVRVTGFDTPFPYTLEHDYMPTIDRIAHAVKKVKAF